MTADHETGGLGLIGVGNERYQPKTLGYAVRDYAAVFRFEPDQAVLDFFPNYERDAQGYPIDPDPSRKVIVGWAATPDHYENWLANRVPVSPATNAARVEVDGKSIAVPTPATANPARDGMQDRSPGGGRQVPRIPGAGDDRKWRDRLPREGLSAGHRHGGRSPHHQRAHRLRRAAVGLGTWRPDLHGHLREHGCLQEDSDADRIGTGQSAQAAPVERRAA